MSATIDQLSNQLIIHCPSLAISQLTLLHRMTERSEWLLRRRLRGQLRFDQTGNQNVLVMEAQHVDEGEEATGHDRSWCLL